MGMTVPHPGRRDDEITRHHPHPPAVHGCDAPFPFEHQPQGRLRMTVLGRLLAGQDQLQAGIEAVRVVP